MLGVFVFEVPRGKTPANMNLFYRTCRGICRFTRIQTIRIHALNGRSVDREGAFVLAVTHLSHLEPAVLSVLNDREIDWMTRKEFYCNWLVAWIFARIRCFRVDRQGIPVSAIRTGISRLRAGRVVGIFPEGGVATGREAVIRGGPLKRGFCSMAIRAGAPIIPCVVLGTEKLLCVKAWLPFRRSQLWVAYGEPIHPPHGCRSTRESRRQLADAAAASFQRLYASLRDRYGISDLDVP